MAAGLSGLGTKRRRQGLPIAPILSSLMVLAAIGLFVYQLIHFSQQSDQLAASVSIAGVNVGGLSPGEAVSRWEQAFAQPVVLYYEDSPILLDPASIGFRTNKQAMLAAARAQTDAGSSFWSRFFNHLTGQEAQQQVSVELSADYQQNLLKQFLQDIAARYDRAAGQPGYDPQTLTFRPGDNGYRMDVDAALTMADRALRSPDLRTVRLPVSSANPPSPGINSLRDMITAYFDSQGFIYDGQTSLASIYIQDLETGEEVNIQSDVAVSAASTVKISILIDYFRHLLLTPTQDEAWLMANSLLCSNNASSNLIMQIIGNGDIFTGIGDVARTQQYVGAKNSYISAPLYLGAGQTLGSIPAPPTSPNPNFNTHPDPFNQTTTEDLGTMLNMIYDCALNGSGLMVAYPNDFTQQECHEMLELMSANDLERLLQGGIPPDATISHKNGWLDNIHGDAGIVFPPNGHNYIIAVFVWENADFFSYTTAWPLIEGVSRASWNYFSPNTPLLAARTDLPDAAQECANFLPPEGSINLDNINQWRSGSASPNDHIP
jgi:beta-lactamase family protein/putative peptidoglycan binding protein